MKGIVHVKEEKGLATLTDIFRYCKSALTQTF